METKTHNTMHHQTPCLQCGYASNETMHPSISNQRSESVALLLKSNERPADLEEGHLSTTLFQAQGRLESVQTRIDSVKGLLDKLCQERTELQQVIKEHKAVLSPLRRISTEVLTEILLLSADKVVSLDTKLGCWQLSNVCHRWRELIISLPRFWSTIHIKQRGSISSSALSIMHTILCRSGNAMLNVVFDVKDRDPDAIAAWGPLLELLSSGSLRWLTLEFTGTLKIAEYMRQVKGHLPRLEELTVDILDHMPSMEKIYDLWADAPRLQSVACPKMNTRLRLPWSQITRYKTGIFSRQGLDILSAHCNITHLVLNATDCNISPVTTPVRLNYVRQLDLSWGTGVLDHLTLPALSIMAFRYGSCQILVRPLSQLCTRSKCRITHFTLDNPLPPIEDATVLSLYEVIPSVIEMEFRNVGPKSRCPLVNRLKYRHDADPFLLPKLEILRIRPMHGIETTSIIEAIESRARFIEESSQMTPLRSLELYPTGTDRDPITLDPFDRLRTIAP